VLDRSKFKMDLRWFIVHRASFFFSNHQFWSERALNIHALILGLWAMWRGFPFETEIEGGGDGIISRGRLRLPEMWDTNEIKDPNFKSSSRYLLLWICMKALNSHSKYLSILHWVLSLKYTGPILESPQAVFPLMPHASNFVAEPNSPQFPEPLLPHTHIALHFFGPQPSHTIQNNCFCNGSEQLLLRRDNFLF